MTPTATSKFSRLLRISATGHLIWHAACVNFGHSVNICLKITSWILCRLYKYGSVVRVTVGTSLCVFFRNVTAVDLPAYLPEISQLSRSTVRGPMGCIVRLLDSGIKKREGKAALSLVPGENALQRRHFSLQCRWKGATRRVPSWDRETLGRTC